MKPPYLEISQQKERPTLQPQKTQRQFSAAQPKRLFRFSLLLIGFIWSLWIVLLTPTAALRILQENWEAAVTMLVGSVVAGGSAMGGGAVAFPVLTKLMALSPHDAKVFAVSIQSIGMSAASLMILIMRTPVDWALIRWVSTGGLGGMMIGTFVLAPTLPNDLIKMAFTMMVTSFAIVMIISYVRRTQRCLQFPQWSHRDHLILLITGLVGGTMSGLVGTGIDTFSFSVMTLLFQMCESISTPTSVILMAVNAIVGVLIHSVILNDFVEPIKTYWIACIPVVVVGAPVGAIICNYLNRGHIVTILCSLCFVELLSSLLFISFTPSLAFASIFILIFFICLYSGMSIASPLIFKAQSEYLVQK